MTKKEQFTNTYRQYYSKVFRLCKGYFKGDIDTANDVAQEIFISVWQHMDEFRRESTISTWLYRISVNCCLLHVRKGFVKKEIRLQHLPEVAQDGNDPITEERLRKMYSCIGQLEESGKVIILLVLEGVEYAEIAAVLGISEETLRVRIHRIKKQLANCVKI